MPHLLHRPARRRTTALALVALVMAILTAGLAPAQAINVVVKRTMFGVHDTRLHSLDDKRTGGLRVYLGWSQIEKAPGHYDWDELDNIVTHAQADHVPVLLTLVRTPPFYASKPTAMPPLLAWKNFVRAVMTRYRDFNGSRGIESYQIWNEGNIATYWTGTPGQLAALNYAAYQVRNEVDPGAKLIGPSFVMRYPYQLKWFAKWAKTRVGTDSDPVWKFDDALSFSLYPLNTYGDRVGVPEDSLAIYDSARKVLTQAGVPSSMPVWGTEINFGLVGGSEHPAATPAPMSRQIANVIRSYVLLGSAGVKRLYWFMYDLPTYKNGTIANTMLTDLQTGSQLTPAGKAFYMVQGWLKGKMIGPSKAKRPCQQDKHGTYLCAVKDKHGMKRIYWNPFGTSHVRLHKGSKSLQKETGTVVDVHGGQRIKVTYKPVMVRSKS